MLSSQKLRIAAFSTAVILSTVSSGAALAQKQYDTGATDTEIKIGNIMPYSGPASAYGVIGKTEEAYFKKINAEGGINGRKINFISYDDGYSPPKAVEQARKLVESDEVLLVFNPLGTASNSAIQKYLNSKKVPQLFVATGATKWNDPKDFPWTMGWQPSYQSEARIYAKFLMKEKPEAKIAVLYQNDDFGKDYLKGLKDGLSAKPSMIVAEESYETAEPTIDGHIVRLKASGADVFISITTPKFAAQAIKKMAEIEWKPMHIVSNVSSSVGAVMRPAGFENSQGILSASYAKDGADPQWDDDLGMLKFFGFLAKYYPDVRGQSDPGERHEAGGQPQGLCARHVAARNQDQHQPDRLRRDRAAANDAVQGREMGAVRRGHQWRAWQLSSFCGAEYIPLVRLDKGADRSASLTTKEAAPATIVAGAYS
jgi:branched-chain amino acid transport system substrate-binding protein